MSSLVTLGESVKITVTFNDWNENSGTGNPVDPDIVTGTVKDLNFTPLLDFNPTNLEPGVYQYTWTPNALGKYYIEFVGSYAIDGTTDTVRQLYEVVALAQQGVTTTVNLGEDQYLNFMHELGGIYVDPDEIRSLYPDASPIEINEFLYIYSQQVNDLLGGAELSTTAYEYIKAATACALSKVYDLGAADVAITTLGDLQVTNQSGSGRSINLSTATSWCELAPVLWEELKRTQNRAGIRAVRKGDGFVNPIPTRELQDRES